MMTADAMHTKRRSFSLGARGEPHLGFAHWIAVDFSLDF
jgi:hypothetical protein